MKLYFAPLEGITGLVYRRAYDSCFPGVIDKYYAPFISAVPSGQLSKKDLRDISPENNAGMCLVPQLIARASDGFISTAKTIAGLGYDEINLNLGCPSGTVTAKGKGSGFLAFPDELDRFFEDIFSALDVRISVKTRIGFKSREEFPALLEIFRKYPISELTIHPRLKTDMYKNRPDTDMFRLAYDTLSAPLCYNGDIFSREDYENTASGFPGLSAVMLGRGLIASPGLGPAIRGQGAITLEALQRFHNMVLEGYINTISGDKNVMYKMRELWSYMAVLFPDGQKQLKAMKKAASLAEYRGAAKSLFHSCTFVPSAVYKSNNI